MTVANPILSKPDAFTRSPQYQANQHYGQAYGQPMPGYQQQAYGQPEGYGQPQATPVGGAMTLDDVIAKTAITMLVLVAAAALSWLFVPLTLIAPVLVTSGIVGLITVFLVARRADIPVGGVLAYAVIEGVFIGVFSKFFNFLYEGIVSQAVLATFIAAGATLAAYKFFNIRVTPKFQKVVFIATASLAVVLLVNFGLAIAGIDTGLRSIGSGAGWLAIGVSVLAVGLAVLNLIIDFDSVERGIAMRAPAKESWRAAFGITITMVWLYVEILRILSYFRD